MKKIIIVCALFALVFTVGLGMDHPSQAVTGKTYRGTVYVAGMGGHFAAADVEINPEAENPIKVTRLDRLIIGGKDTHPTHDPRIDTGDRSRMYWSTYRMDKTMEGRTVHVGVTDLESGKVIKDRAIQLDPRAIWTGALYCASAQTERSYMPMTMTDEAYIDVFDKKSLTLSHRVFLDYKPKTTRFYHGINSPDMKQVVVAVNRSENDQPNGKIDMVLLDADALDNGKAKVLKKETITGKPGRTLTFRQTFTPDGKYILQSGGDRFFLIDAKTLKVRDEEMMSLGENHDAVTTPDGNYAVLTVRTKVKDGDTAIIDGELLLYDISKKKVVGGSTSVCVACHRDIGIKGNATLCGADINWQ